MTTPIRAEALADRFDITDNTANLKLTGGVTATGPLGYATGAGSTVTQLTNKSTAVEINALCGQITTASAAMGSGLDVFRVTNSYVAATDVVVVSFGSVPQGSSDVILLDIQAIGDGYFDVQLVDYGANGGAVAIVINFIVIKAVIA
jgi:hypothetical protein